MERDACHRQMEKWIQQGYVETSEAWVACNPLFVEKKDGTLRMCIDYRPINAQTTMWDWPLPKIRDMRLRIQEWSWFSRIDLKEAFHRIRIPEAYRPWTAFHTPQGKYQFTVMPFGLCTAPATYQRFMDWVLHDVKAYVINYVDDILVGGRTLVELRQRTRAVLRRLRKASVTINDLKSEYDKQELTFVGLLISRGTIGSALPVGERVVPTTKNDWLSALGYANCFRDFLPNLSELTSGLYPGANQLPARERASKFVTLWNSLSTAVKLTHYDDRQEGQLFVDASQKAVGAVLSQKGKVCAVFSKSLTPSQTRYSATDREHLALMLGVEAFRVFLQSNQRITVNTDHTALLNRDDDRLSHRQYRWKLRIAEITTNFRYVKGSDNPADFWSRKGWELGGKEQIMTHK